MGGNKSLRFWLIWGELGNLRFCPELLCSLAEHHCEKLFGLHHPVHRVGMDMGPSLIPAIASKQICLGDKPITLPNKSANHHTGFLDLFGWIQQTTIITRPGVESVLADEGQHILVVQVRGSRGRRVRRLGG